jgi:hypothetical protein
MLPHNPLHNLDAIRESAPPITGDDIAENERSALYADHRRKQRVKNVLNWVFIVFVVITSIIAISIVSVRLLHLALPAGRQWLTADQIQSIDKLFFSGAVGGFLVSYFKRASD